MACSVLKQGLFYRFTGKDIPLKMKVVLPTNVRGKTIPKHTHTTSHYLLMV